jgi:peroxiredoxin
MMSGGVSVPTIEPTHRVQPGEPAPDFELPVVQEEAIVSLADYRGRRPLFLALFVGLYCPFCRRSIARLGGLRDKLEAAGVDTLGVVATELDNARLYFKYRPSRIPLAADPEFSTHRAYGLQKMQVDEAMMAAISKVRVNPTGELPEPLPPGEASDALDRAEGFQRTETDLRDIERQWPLVKAQFLVDREGIVRWANVECEADGFAGIGKFPADEEILAAARLVS